MCHSEMYIIFQIGTSIDFYVLFQTWHQEIYMVQYFRFGHISEILYEIQHKTEIQTFIMLALLYSVLFLMFLAQNLPFLIVAPTNCNHRSVCSVLVIDTSCCHHYIPGLNLFVTICHALLNCICHLINYSLNLNKFSQRFSQSLLVLPH